jgi:hypothetical protein
MNDVIRKYREDSLEYVERMEEERVTKWACCCRPKKKKIPW